VRIEDVPSLNPLRGCALAMLLMSVAAARLPPARAGDLASRGRIEFLRCASCHAISAGVSGKVGPSLEGIVGRKVATEPGYPYSAALRAQNFVWDEAHLDRWLTDPNAVAPGTAMAFAGIPDAVDRGALIEYLRSLGEDRAHGAGASP
jgi:cytochrome c